MSATNAKRLTRAQSIKQAKSDIRVHLAAYKSGEFSATFATEGIDRIAAFFPYDQVEAYAATARNQIAAREKLRAGIQ